MKKPSLVRAFFLLSLVLIFRGSVGANAELDRRYALETVGFLKSWDNVDGLFANYVAQAYRDYFAQQSRFRLQDLSQANPLIERSTLPYQKLIDDPKILEQISRTFKVDTIIRTKVFKEGVTYRFVLEWMLAPKMDLLSSYAFRMEEPSPGQLMSIDQIQGQLQNAVDQMIKQVPFVGQITGREENWITINLGRISGIKKGDIFKVGTVEDVKKHPILGTLVDWKFTDTGEIQIEDADERMAFAKQTQEIEGRKIGRFQKLLKWLPAPEEDGSRRSVEVLTANQEIAKERAEMPKSGWASVGLLFGGYHREYTLNGTERVGGGFLYGAKADGQLWFTREFFGELGFAYGAFGFSHADSSGVTTLENQSGHMSQFSLSGGYTYFLTPDLFGPKGWAKLGYRTTSYSLPLNSTESLSSSSFGSIFLGLGAEMPLTQNFGVLLSFDLGIFKSGSEESGSVSLEGVTDVRFFGGVFYRLSHRSTLKVGAEFFSHGGEPSSTSTLSNRTWIFSPGIQYFF